MNSKIRILVDQINKLNDSELKLLHKKLQESYLDFNDDDDYYGFRNSYDTFANIDERIRDNEDSILEDIIDRIALSLKITTALTEDEILDIISDVLTEDYSSYIPFFNQDTLDYLLNKLIEKMDEPGFDAFTYKIRNDKIYIYFFGGNFVWSDDLQNFVASDYSDVDVDIPDDVDDFII